VVPQTPPPTSNHLHLDVPTRELDSNLPDVTVIPLTPPQTSNHLHLDVPTRTIQETPFVFEEPKPSYFEIPFAERQELLSLGPLHSQRLAHIARVHVVYQPLQKTQITVAHRLDSPHYQATSLQISDSKFHSFLFYQEDQSRQPPSSNFIYISCFQKLTLTCLADNFSPGIQRNPCAKVTTKILEYAWASARQGGETPHSELPNRG
jgi:hypothetical protein